MNSIESSDIRDSSTAELDLEGWRRKEGLTYAELAVRIGATNARQARAWALGLERPRAIAIERIVGATGGEVTVHAMHVRRLAWERRNPGSTTNFHDQGAEPLSVQRARDPELSSSG